METRNANGAAPPVDEDVAPDIKEQIINNEIAVYRNTRFRAEMLHRANKRIGADAQVLKGLTDEVARCEGMIEALLEERAVARKANVDARRI